MKLHEILKQGSQIFQKKIVDKEADVIKKNFDNIADMLVNIQSEIEKADDELVVKKYAKEISDFEKELKRLQKDFDDLHYKLVFSDIASKAYK